MRNQLSHTVGIHTVEVITFGSHKIALYTVLLYTVDGEILLLPVRVRHAKNAQTWSPMLLYTPLQRVTFNTTKNPESQNNFDILQ